MAEDKKGKKPVGENVNNLDFIRKKVSRIEIYMRNLNWIFLIFAIIFITAVLYYGKPFLLPFALAILLSFLFYPVLNFLNRLKIPVYLSWTIMLTGVFLIFFLLGSILYNTIAAVNDRLPDYINSFKVLLNRLEELSINYLGTNIMPDKAEMEQLLTPEFILSKMFSSVGKFINFISQTALMMLFLTFILIWRRIFGQKIRKFFNAEKNQENKGIISCIVEQIQSYLIIKFFISLVTGLVFGLGCWAFQIDFPLLLGFLAFLLNFVPSIGPILATLPAVFLAFILHEPLFAIFASLVLSGIQYTSGIIIEPKIMGDRLNLNIIVVLLSLLTMGLVWGIMGMIISIPLISSINIIMSNIQSLKRFSILMSK